MASKKREEASATFQFDHLEPGAAQMLILEFCAQQAEESCRLYKFNKGGGRSGGSASVSGPPATLARIGRELAAHDAVGSTQRFQVALVEATKTGPRQLEGLSEGARRALEDAATLLPYEGLALRGVALIETALEAATQVSGPGDLEYRVALRMEPVVTLEGLRLVVHEFELSRSAQIRAEGRPPVPPGSVLQTSFEVTPGETVVVGTSRLDGGDAALIVLATAVPASPTAGE